MKNNIEILNIMNITNRIKSNRAIFIFLFFLASGSLFAQIENIPLITVTGESVIKALPNYCLLGIRVEKEIPTNSRGETIGFEIFKDVDTRISLFNIDDSDIIETIIQVSNHKLVKEIFIKIKDLNKLDRYLIDLSKLGFDEYIFVDYRNDNYESIKNEARKEAITSAEKKAKLLASELGQTIGSAHTIGEMDYKSYNIFNIENYSNLENVTYNLGADKYLVEPGYITITAKIQVSFDLKK
jgi:uncharacterized protein